MDEYFPSQMVFTKICPQCGSEQHRRRSVCEKCGFVWHSKACKKVNQSEQEIKLHREKNRVNQARKRARRVSLRLLSVEQVKGSIRQEREKL